jgi:pyruvate-formate lyase-activating enzyme
VDDHLPDLRIPAMSKLLSRLKVFFFGKPWHCHYCGKPGVAHHYCDECSGEGISW